MPHCNFDVTLIEQVCQHFKRYNLASTDSQRKGLTRLRPPTSPARIARIARIAIRDAPWSAAPLYAFFLRANCSQLPFSTFLNFPHRCCSEPHDLPRIARFGSLGTDWTDYQASDVSDFNPGQSVHVRAPKSLRANPIRLIRPKPAHATDSALKPLKINDFSQLFNPDASIYVQLQSGWSVWKFCYQMRNFNSFNTWKMNNSKK